MTFEITFRRPIKRRSGMDFTYVIDAETRADALRQARTSAAIDVPGWTVFATREIEP